MSHTDHHSRPARRPEHADNAPRYQPRPEPRRSSTPRQAMLVLMRDVEQRRTR